MYTFFGPGTVYDLPLNNPYRPKGGECLALKLSLNYLLEKMLRQGMSAGT